MTTSCPKPCHSRTLNTTKATLTTASSYDAFGHLLQVREPGMTADRIPRITPSEYNEPYRVGLTGFANALNQETRADYNDDGSLMWIQDATGPAPARGAMGERRPGAGPR